jgi:hypothetical protein
MSSHHDTSSVPYFIREEAVGKGLASVSTSLAAYFIKICQRCSERSLGTVERKFAREKLLCLRWKRPEKSALARVLRQPHGSSALLPR